MRRLAVYTAIVGLCGLVGVANAGKQPFQIADDLGNMVASEGLCGLVYDQGAVAAYISENIPESDMSFPASLSTAVSYIKPTFDKMSASEKTAHCVQIVRVAKYNKFIK